MVMTIGGSRGMGAAISKRFAAEVAKVVVTDRARIVLEAVARFGGVDIVVNNATSACFNATPAQLRRYTPLAFEINYWASLGLAKQAIENMLVRGGGWISHISGATWQHPDAAPNDPQNRSFPFHQHTSPALYGTTTAALEPPRVRLAAVLAPVGIARNTLASVKAVAAAVKALPSGVMDAPTLRCRRMHTGKHSAWTVGP